MNCFPCEIVRGKKIQVSPDNYDTLVIPSSRKYIREIYFTKVSTKNCSCPGFFYHGYCKHLKIAEKVKANRNEKTREIAKEKFGEDLGSVIAEFI